MKGRPAPDTPGLCPDRLLVPSASDEVLGPGSQVVPVPLGLRPGFKDPVPAEIGPHIPLRLTDPAGSGLGKEQPAAVEKLVATLEDEQAVVVSSACIALSMLGEAAVAARRGRTGRDRPAAEKAAPALRAALATDTTEGLLGYGPQAANALARVAPKSMAEVVEFLVLPLDQPTRGAMPESRRSAVLIRMLEEEQLPKIGARVATSLMAVLGAKAAGAVPNLVAALDSEDPILVEICCRALGEIGPAAKAALPRLEELQESQNPNVKAAATRAVELLK